MVLPTLPQDLKTLTDNLLNQGFLSATDPLIRYISNDLSAGNLGIRLRELADEAARLRELGQDLTLRNSVIVALQNDLDVAVREYLVRASSLTGNLQQSGIQAANNLFAQSMLGINFNIVDPNAVLAELDLITSPAYEALLNSIRADASAEIQRAILAGIIRGDNPLDIAALIQEKIASAPLWRLNTLMRTTQLTAYRRATAMNQLANRDVLEGYAIWIATLDRNVCLACLSKHGTRIELGEVVNGHHNCRCTSVAPIKGRPLTIQTGENWYNSLTPDEQRALAGEANYNALQAGAVKLSDFQQLHNDPVFGSMTSQASLVSILGSDAQQYYSRG